MKKPPKITEIWHLFFKDFYSRICLFPVVRHAFILLTTTSYTLISVIYGGISVISMAIRIELNSLGYYSLTPNSVDIYNRVISSHGLGMVFLFIMPLLISFFGNWQLPQSYFASDFALPRINILSAWFLMVSSELLILSIAREEGIGAGWTLYPPLSDSQYHSSSAMSLLVLAVHVLGLSSEGGAATFLISLLAARSRFLPGGLFCLYTHAAVTVSILLILTLPVLGTGVTLLLLDRTIAITVLSTEQGGDPLLFQHLFWYFGHPEVYVIILPAFGIVSWTLAWHSGMPSSQHTGMIIAIASIGVVGFFVWAHHMYVTGIAEDTRMYFSSATMVIAIPTAIKIFSWMTVFVHPITWTLQVIGTLTFVVCFVLGGFTGLIIANASMDIIYHDTYYIVGHFHYVLSIAASLAGLLALSLFTLYGLHRPGQQVEGRLVLMILLTGINWIFAVQHPVGVLGHPRRIFSSTENTLVLTEVSNLAVLILLSGPYMMTIAGRKTGNIVSPTGRTAYPLLNYAILNSTPTRFMDRKAAIHEI